MKYYYLKRYSGIFYTIQHHKHVYGYRLTYYDDSHKRHERTQRGYDSAQQAIMAKHSASQRIQQLKTSSNMTFQQWAERVINEKKGLRITTYKSYKHLLEHNVIPYIGKYKLIDLSPGIYQKKCWQHLLSLGKSANTVRDVNAKVQAVMNEAVRKEVIHRNRLSHPQMQTLLSERERPKKDILSESELKQFDKCLFTHSLQWQAIFYTLQMTGMRCGELLALKWNSVDLKHHTVDIHATRDAYGIRQPKTKHSYRKLVIDASLEKVLTKWHIYCIKHYHVNSDSYLIINKQGKPLVPKYVSVWLKQLLIEAGLKQYIGSYTPHQLRHQFASNMIVDHGIDPVVVSRILGHANPTITMKIYAQLSRNKSLNIGRLLDK